MYGTEIAHLFRALPNATLCWLDWCGHFPQVEHAAVVNGWLGEFIAQSVRRSGRW
jgi:pimeloyl-ACP methyl ester carboxylesterase